MVLHSFNRFTLPGPIVRSGKRLSILLLFVLLPFSSSVFAQSFGQNSYHKKVVRELKQFTENSVQTKVYLHMDKELYAAGETIWYKSYLISEPFGFLDTLSSSLYVELVDSDSRVIKRQMIFLQTGLGNGSLEIPSEVLSGLYHIRTYTNWMRNFDEEFFYTQSIEIQNLDQDFEVYQPTASDSLIDLRFFPEGGDLVVGARSKLAFKATGPTGHGMSLEATVYDANDDSVAHIKTRHTGMGLLNFKPEPYQYYYAKISGQPQKYDLPVIKDEGYNIRVDNSYENLISVRIKHVGRKDAREPFLMVQSGGQVYSFVSRIRFDEQGEALISLPKASLPLGINQITLFNADGLPECERLVYIDKKEMLGIGIRMQKKEYEKRERVIIDFQVRDAGGKPMKGSFSLAVVDENYKSVNRFSSNIASEFLLTSDLKGAIEEPLQYFDKENPNREKDLDLLLMTQGWRRFTWKDLLLEPLADLQYRIEPGLTISGQAFYNKKKKPALEAGTVTYFNLDDWQTQANIANIGPDGRFTFEQLIFEKGSEAAIKATDEKGRENIMMQLEQPIVQLPPLPKRSLDWLYYHDQLVTSDTSDTDRILVLSGDYRDLGSVTVTSSKVNGDRQAQKIEKTEYGSRVLDVDELLENTSGQRSILDLLVGRLPSLSVVRLGSSVEDVVVQDTRGQRKMGGGFTSSQPLYILDGQTIEQDMAANIPANMIATLEVLIGPPAALYGVRGMNGVIVLKSKEGVDAWSGPPMLGLVELKEFGYDFGREFYSPQYDIEDENHQDPDRRTLLYWAPNIVTNDIGQAQISFFAGDLAGTYLIDFQGIGVNGKPGVLTRRTFSVK